MVVGWGKVWFEGGVEGDETVAGRRPGTTIALAHRDPQCAGITSADTLIGPFKVSTVVSDALAHGLFLVWCSPCASAASAFPVHEGRRFAEVSGGLPTLGRRSR